MWRLVEVRVLCRWMKLFLTRGKCGIVKLLLQISNVNDKHCFR